MGEKIRKITEEDFPEVSGLFNYNKSIEELRWLFRDPKNPKHYNAFVALDGTGRLVGCIGYVISKYQQNEKKVKGVIPMSWKVLSGYKGMAGVLLIKKVLEMGDFGFTTGGTKTAHSLFPIFKLDYLKGGYKYFKIFDIWRFFNSLEEGLIKRICKTIVLLPACFKSINEKDIYEDLILNKYYPDRFVNDLLVNKDFHKPMNKEYLSWLLECPTLKTYAFLIERGQKVFGVCIFYIKDVKGSKRGRIIYLPFLGNNLKLWRSVLHRSFEFFKNQKCCSISTIATNKTWYTGFKTGMFKFIKSRPIYLKDTKFNLKDIDIQNWNIQYTEGDTAYVKI